MAKYGPSLSERKAAFLEDCCSGAGGGMGMGVDPAGEGSEAFSGDSDPRGPVAGLDKALGKIRSKRKRKEKTNGS